MSKIEEMASTAEYQGVNRKAFEEGFIEGANAVLREIEKALDAAFETLCINDGYVKAREVIRELKGE